MIRWQFTQPRNSHFVHLWILSRAFFICPIRNMLFMMCNAFRFRYSCSFWEILEISVLVRNLLTRRSNCSCQRLREYHYASTQITVLSCSHLILSCEDRLLPGRVDGLPAATQEKCFFRLICTDLCRKKGMFC